MAGRCHIHNFGVGKSDENGLVLETCGQTFGCRTIGCFAVSECSPGYYNEAGGYTVDPEIKDRVEFVPVGSVEDRARLEKALSPETPHAEAVELLAGLDIQVVDCTGEAASCSLCGVSWG